MVGVLAKLSGDAELLGAGLTLERLVGGVGQPVVDPALSEGVLASAVFTAVALPGADVLVVGSPAVRRQTPRPGEALSARRTDVGPNVAVDAGVLLQLVRLGEPLRALVAGERLFAGVNPLVLDELSADDETPRTLGAGVGLHAAVGPPVIVHRGGRSHRPITLFAVVTPRTLRCGRRRRRFRFSPFPRGPSLSAVSQYGVGRHLSSNHQIFLG